MNKMLEKEQALSDPKLFVDIDVPPNLTLRKEKGCRLNQSQTNVE